MIDKSKRILMIMNPKSGTMQASKMLSDIIQTYSDDGYSTTVLMTQARNDARRFAHDYSDEFETIVVSGGDGTLNEVIDGLIRSGNDCNIGYIPSGSTNDFAASVGLPKGVLESAEQVVHGEPRTLDIGSFNGRYFTYIASFGAFTSTSYKVPQNLKNVLGHTAYILQGIRDVVGIRPIHARIVADEGTPNEKICEGDYLFGAICNSTSVAGILKLDHFDIDMNDGLMEVLMVKSPDSVVALNETIRSMIDGKLESKDIEFFSAKNIRVEIDESVPWTLDGEYEPGAGTIDINTIRSAFKLIV